MSCEKNGNRAGAAAAVSGGISNLQSKAAAAGSGPANRALNVIDREGPVAQVARRKDVTLTGALARGVALSVPAAIVGFKAGISGGRSFAALNGSILAGNLALAYRARLKADKSQGPVDQVGIPQKYLDLEDEAERQVQVWPRQGDPAATVFNVPFRGNWQNRQSEIGGQPATILKSHALAGHEFYFKGRLSNRDAVGIVTGQQAAHKLPGYVGTISSQEKLSPTWAAAKRGLILQSYRHKE